MFANSNSEESKWMAAVICFLSLLDGGGHRSHYDLATRRSLQNKKLTTNWNISNDM